MVGSSKIFTPQSKYSAPLMALFVSPAAIKFTVMWLLMSVFFLSAERIESTDATEGTRWGIPSEWDPLLSETPSAGDRNPLWFSTLVKVNTPPPPVPSLHISQPRYDQLTGFSAQNGALFRSQPTRCLFIQQFLLLLLLLLFVLSLVWTFSKGDSAAECESLKPSSVLTSALMKVDHHLIIFFSFAI